MSTYQYKNANSLMIIKVALLLVFYISSFQVSSQPEPIGAKPLSGDQKGFISSPYGQRLSPFTGDHEQHDGVDIPSQAGSPILATGDGIVSYAGFYPGYGNLIEINHGQGYTSRYGHAQALLVKTGDQVKQSQTIATVGSTGKSTGPHLHFEVSFKGVPFDPLILLGSQYFKSASMNESILVFTSKRLKAPSQLTQYTKGNKNPEILYTSHRIKTSGQPYIIVRAHSP